MQTIYDWVTVAIFAGLIVVFLQRSVGDGEPRDSVWSYAPPSLGCMASNWLGNKGFETGSAAFHLLGVLGIAAVLAYTYYVIKPFQKDG